MSIFRKNNLVRTSVTGNSVGGGTIFTYPITEDTSILAEASAVCHDSINSPALGSAVFISVAGAKRLGTSSATVIGTGNQVILSEVDVAIAGGSPALGWGISGNNLVLQLTTPSGAANMFFECDIILHIN